MAQVPLEGVLFEAYNGTRRKHNMKFRQIGHTTSQYGQSFFPKSISAWNGLVFAEAPALAVFRSKLVDEQIGGEGIQDLIDSGDQDRFA